MGKVSKIEAEEVTVTKKKATKKTATKKSAKVVSKNSFASHIERIKEAKSLSDSVIASVPLNARAASVALLWEIVFDILCNSSELDISDFNTVAGIIQKLASSRVSEIPSIDSVRPSENRDVVLSPETLAKIEEQLKLL